MKSESVEKVLCESDIQSSYEDYYDTGYNDSGYSDWGGYGKHKEGEDATDD